MSRRVEEWKSGRVEEWKSGRVEENREFRWAGESLTPEGVSYRVAEV
jgi:hypothetical protein